MSVVRRDAGPLGRFSFRRILAAIFRDKSAPAKGWPICRAEAMEGRCLLSAVTWMGAHNNGLWSDSLNWTGGAGVPTAADDVTVAAGFAAISISGAQHAHSLSSASPLQITSGGMLDVTTTASISADLTIGGTLKNATVTASGGAAVVATSTGGYLDTVTLNGNLDLTRQSSTFLYVYGGLVLNGTAYLGKADGSTVGTLIFGGTSIAAGSLAGNGTVVFGGHNNNGILNLSNLAAPNGTLTLGPKITVHGANGILSNNYGIGTIVNQGTINADTIGGTIIANYVSNNGTVEATAGAITLGGLWTNAGTLSAIDSTVNLGGSFTSAALGDFNSSGGVVNLTGTYTGDLTLDANTGSWTLAGGTINGGTVNESGEARLIGGAGGGILKSVTINGDLDLSNGSQVTVYGSLVLNGTVYLGSAQDPNVAGVLYFGDRNVFTPETFDGNGTVVFGASSSNGLYNTTDFYDPRGTLTVGSGITIRGKNGVFGSYLTYVAPIINHATIIADTAGGTITVGDPINGPYTGGVMTNTGLMEATAGTLVLGDGFTAGSLQTVQSVGGVVYLSGGLPGDLTLDATTGSWTFMGGSLANGTLTESGGAKLLFSKAGGSLSGMTVNGDMDLTRESGAQATIIGGGLVLNGTAYVGNADGSTYGQLVFGDQYNAAGSLEGSGTVLFGPNPNNAISNYFSEAGADAALTIGPGITVRGNGRIDNIFYGDSIINQGTIDADTAGQSITVIQFTGTFSNSGVVEATAGTLKVGNTSNLSGGTLSGGTWEVSSGGKLILPSAVTSIDANVVLDGAGSAITDSGGVNSAFTALSGVNYNASLSILHGVSLSVAPDAGTFTNYGTISLGADCLLSVTGAFAQTFGTLAVHIAGSTPASFSRVSATDDLMPGGVLQVTLDGNYDPLAGENFSVVVGSSETGHFDAFTGMNTPGGLALAPVYTATSVTVIVDPAAPALLGTQIDDGNRQRSIVRSLTFTFSSPVTHFDGGITLALLNTGGSGADDGSAPTDASAALGVPTSFDGGLSWVVSIVASAFSSFGSLNDGIYTATIHATAATDAFGQTLSGGDQTKTFHRLYGDINGDKKVSNADFATFALAFGSTFGQSNYSQYFDITDNNAKISNADFTQFANRFNKTFVYTG